MKWTFFMLSSWILAFLSGMLLGSSNIFSQDIIEEVNYSSITIKIPGVTDNEHTGIVAFLTTEIRQGKGRVLVNIKPQFELSTQGSAGAALSAASKYSSVYFGDKDVIFTIIADAPIVGGPSAGAAMAISLVALVSNIRINPNVMITGEVTSQGLILPVGGLQGKIDAASKVGISEFLIPRGERLQVVYKSEIRKEEIFPGIHISKTEYIPIDMDIIEYANETYGITVIEVGTIEEALSYMANN